MTLQEQSLRAWPTVAAGSSVTMNAYFYSRQTEGVGAFGTGNPAPGTLSIVFPQGRTDLTTVAALRETMIVHVLNHNPLLTWWSPRNTTPEAALRAALASWIPRAFDASTSVQFWFDGQFGPVLVA